MKYLIALLVLTSLTACAPEKVRVRNCIALDLNYYECEIANSPYTHGKSAI